MIARQAAPIMAQSRLGSSAPNTHCRSTLAAAGLTVVLSISGIIGFPAS